MPLPPPPSGLPQRPPPSHVVMAVLRTSILRDLRPHQVSHRLCLRDSVVLHPVRCRLALYLHQVSHSSSNKLLLVLREGDDRGILIGEAIVRKAWQRDMIPETYPLD